MTNMVALNSKMAKIGPRKAPKKTPRSLMKQLEGERRYTSLKKPNKAIAKSNVCSVTVLTI